MRKYALLFFTLAFLQHISWSQITYPTVTIQDIQTVSPTDLSACIDSSSLTGDTVLVRGIAVMDGDLSQLRGPRNVWIQDGTGAFSGLDLFSSNPTLPIDLDSVLAGDSLELIGYVDEFFGETELVPINVSILSSGHTVYYETINLSDLNDTSQVNLLPTGEQWEGSYIELLDVTVTSINYFAGGTRVSLTVEDVAGNRINVSDRFLVQRLPVEGGTFVVPSVGTQYCSLRGIVTHSENGCAGIGGRGYELQPFDASHYQVCFGNNSPEVADVFRDLVTPTSTQDLRVTATITDADGNINGGTLYYAIGLGNTAYTPVPMINIAVNTYEGLIPSSSFNDGDFIQYYVCGFDSTGNITCSPNVPGTADNPKFFTVRDNGTTIYDLQFTPFSDGSSGYVDAEVSVEGVVTASSEADNLGQVFIQQDDSTLNSWSGIMCLGHPDLDSLVVGDKVRVTGIVRENFEYTRLEDILNIQLLSTGHTIEPTELSPSTFSTYDFIVNEAYEGMLVRLTSPALDPVYVVDANADDPSNFAEYRIGLDTSNTVSGCRVLAGRQTSSAFGSLNVSFVNDSLWMNSSGVMNVPPCVVSVGDSMDSMTGIMYYSFSEFKILPRTNLDVPNYLGECSPVCGKDAFEDNDEINTAVEIPIMGILGDARICPMGDEDWFRFYVPLDEPYMKVSLSNLAANFELEIYDDNGLLLYTSYNAGSADEEIVANAILPGLYFIRVFGLNDAFHASQGYYLRAQTRTAPYLPLPNNPPCLDAFEANDTLTTATPLPAIGTLEGTYICPSGDEDWYTIQVASNQNNLKVKLTELPEDFNIGLYNSNGILINSSSNSALNEETIVINNIAPGLYYIRVFGPSGNWSTQPYSLNAHTRNFPYVGIGIKQTLNEFDDSHNGFKLYPNPITSGLLHLQYTVEEASIGTYTMYNLHGQAVHTERLSVSAGTHVQEIPVQQFPNGLYIVEFKINGELYRKKVEIQQ